MVKNKKSDSIEGSFGIPKPITKKDGPSFRTPQIAAVYSFLKTHPKSLEIEVSKGAGVGRAYSQLRVLDGMDLVEYTLTRCCGARLWSVK